MLKLLKNHFGYDEFRPLQEEIIESVMANRDALVIMPTGGGKSLCYQLPALQLEGITLVVSPLIALMKDQVDGLKANGISAGFINSSLTPDQIARVQDRAKEGHLKILYVAPERLSVQSFRTFLRSLQVSLIAIDEAHCISEWGHDFRPDYRNLKKLRDEYPNVPIMALTATATAKVRQDIIEQLRFEEAKTFLLSFNRENLTYHVRPKKNALDQLASLLAKYPNQSAIIYCFSRKNTEEVAAYLQERNFNASAYHAGLDPELRKETQEKFIRDEVPIIVATIAFGMGINKPNVRLVVHYDLPKSLEGYYQETGRAGRDGIPSDCVLFYSYGDKMKLDFFIRQISDPDERATAEQKLAQVIEFCELQKCRRGFLLEYFGENWPEQNCNGCDRCLTPTVDADATEISYKIMSAIIRTGERFGINYIVQILLGKKNKKILEQGHTSLSVFGIEKHFKEDDIKHFIHALVARGFLVKNEGEYPTLRVSEKGRTCLESRGKIILPELNIPKEISIVDKQENLDYDSELFEDLRILRKKLADEKNVPPFVIFSDVSLREMAFYFPQSLENFQKISGVGSMKLTEYGSKFMEVIHAHAEVRNLQEKNIPLKQKHKSSSKKSKSRISSSDSTYAQTKNLLLQKLSVQEIAERRTLSPGTILSHLEKIISSGEKLDFEHLRIPSERLIKIETAFKKSGGLILSPVLEILGEGFSYDELRLARLVLQSSAD